MEIRIRGRILGYSDDVAAGLIQGDDGHKYQFDKSEWQSRHLLASKSVVTFAPHSGKAVQVHVG